MGPTPAPAPDGRGRSWLGWNGAVVARYAKSRKMKVMNDGGIHSSTRPTRPIFSFCRYTQRIRQVKIRQFDTICGIELPLPQRCAGPFRWLFYLVQFLSPHEIIRIHTPRRIFERHSRPARVSGQSVCLSVSRCPLLLARLSLSLSQLQRLPHIRSMDIYSMYKATFWPEPVIPGRSHPEKNQSR